MQPTLKDTKLVGRFRPVQICLDCKAVGQTTVTNTVWEMVSHIVEKHEPKK